MLVRDGKIIIIKVKKELKETQVMNQTIKGGENKKIIIGREVVLRLIKKRKWVVIVINMIEVIKIINTKI
jgi:hypothetical protein